MGEKKNKPETGRKALYRKYRSKSLDEVVGQEHITKTLANAIDQGKISHAYLFTGPRGIGKTSIARILAHEINQLPYEGETTHLDIIEIDAASNRRIDDIRDLRDKVHITPVSAKYKVYIIDEVHMLTNESFNALLKTLEEPPEHVIFILATTEVHKLPATIVSRTQRHSFKSGTVEKIFSHLKTIAKAEKINITDNALKLLAQHGDGSFRDSVGLLDQMSGSAGKIDESLVELLLGIAPRSQLQELLEANLSGDGRAVLSQIDTLLEAGITPSGIALQLTKLLRHKLQEDGVLSASLITLMGDLLSVGSAMYQKLRLETLLLAVATTKASDSAVAPNKPSVTAAALATTPVLRREVKTVLVENNTPTVKTELKKETSTKKQHTVENTDITKHWPEILADIKTKNSPLYTILRLARPSLTDTELVLAFGFEFHRKRIDDSKHKTIVAASVETVLGQSPTVITTLDKTLAQADSTLQTHSQIPSPTLPTDPAHASLVAGIQDMMGGGEVIHA